MEGVDQIGYFGGPIKTCLALTGAFGKTNICNNIQPLIDRRGTSSSSSPSPTSLAFVSQPFLNACISMSVCMHVRIDVLCTYVRIYVFVCTYVIMYVCIHRSIINNEASKLRVFSTIESFVESRGFPGNNGGSRRG